MISLLLPSRGRPGNLERLINSAYETAHQPIEVIVMVDNDDWSYAEKYWPSFVKIFNVPRTTLSQYWNLAYEKSAGDIVMLAADDIVFHTQDWDIKVRQAIERHPDKIAFVYGNDGDPNEDKQFGTHGFVHKNWVEAIGRLVPPYFSSDFSDTWLNDVADMIGRKQKVNIFTEHMHYAFRKGELDLTHAERLVRHWKDNMPKKYEETLPERQAEAKKLRQFIGNFRRKK